MMVGNKSRGWKYDRKWKYRRPRGIKIARTKEYFTERNKNQSYIFGGGGVFV